MQDDHRAVGKDGLDSDRTWDTHLLLGIQWLYRLQTDPWNRSTRSNGQVSCHIELTSAGTIAFEASANVDDCTRLLGDLDLLIVGEARMSRGGNAR